MTDPRLVMIKGMLDLIPDGYYATAPDGTGGHVDFVRLTRPIKGKFKGTIKVQSQHSERWKEALVHWPSGQWSIYDRRMIDTLLLVIADYHTCAKRYSIEMQSCCVCGTELTDDRSRHYLIGPVCDKKPQWTWVIDEVDDKNDGLSYEQLVARGMPTRIWQDKALAS